MRKYKFRAWDKALKKWIYLTIGNDGIKISDVPNDVLVMWVRGKRVGKWQQFTGLLDENGKEIFEGDVVRQRGIKFASYEVVYEAPKFRLKSSQGVMDNKKILSNCEIIGNIYESPELIA